MPITISSRARRLIKWTSILIGVIAASLLFFLLYHTDVTKNVDSYVYELPYKRGGEHRIVQGYGGLFSHSHTAALDFEMPVGTPVYAAREGLVYSYKDDSNEGGISPAYKRKANYIMIRHDDGSFGCYWHLEKNGVLIKKGRVSKGQQIGRSGATGMVFRPHLHFSVKRWLNYDMDSFVKTKFNTASGVKLLTGWKSYVRP